MSTDWLDSSIIEGCLKNDRRAQEQLYKQFYGPMMTLCLRYTRNQDDALEVLHNGFLKVFQHLGSYDSSKGALYTWMKTIVVNSAIDFIRRRNTFTSSIELKEAQSVSADSDVVEKMSATELLKLIRQLPQTSQTVFNLYVVEGYRHKEIGEVLGISEGTSKWHLSEARKQLKKLLLTMHVLK